LPHLLFFASSVIPTAIVGTQGVRKRCRLSWLTNSALVYEPQPNLNAGEWVAGSLPMSTAVHMEPKLTLEI